MWENIKQRLTYACSKTWHGFFEQLKFMPEHYVLCAVNVLIMAWLLIIKPKLIGADQYDFAIFLALAFVNLNTMTLTQSNYRMNKRIETLERQIESLNSAYVSLVTKPKTIDANDQMK